MRSILSWLVSWKETLVIKYWHPELYRELTRPLDGTDFGRVPRP